MLKSWAVAAALLGTSATLTLNEVTEHVRTLAAPSMEGRLTGTPGMDRAADYIAGEFKDYGLQPGPDGSYFTTFPITIGMVAGPDNLLGFSGPKTFRAKLEEDFVPLSGSLSGRPVSGEVVYVGYGIKAEKWDDYAGVDLKGKVALAFRGVPEGADRATTGQKARWAAEAGAVGLLVIGPNAPGRPELPRYSRAEGLPNDLDFVGAAVHSRLFPTLTGMDFEAARAAKAPASKPTGFTVRLMTELSRRELTGKDVVAYLPGNDPALKDEFVIFGAHFDHLGYGEVGSTSGTTQIHYGADDNASGTSAVLALARHFASTKSNRRTMVFQLYSGEEEGLVGSEAWARSNPEILAKTTAMLNLDMVGRLRDEKLYVFGTSSATEWESLLASVGSVQGVQPQLAPNVRGDSDQASFARRNVPVLFFHTGLHAEYHSEKDTMDTINYDGIMRTAQYAAKVGEAVDRAAKLTWNTEVQMGNRPSDRNVPSSGGDQRRVRVGFMPDMAAGGPGVRITGTTPDSPAAKAGFKEGDRILELGGKKTPDLEAMSEAMRALKPGDKVKVVFLRDGKELTVEMVVEERTGG